MKKKSSSAPKREAVGTTNKEEFPHQHPSISINNEIASHKPVQDCAATSVRGPKILHDSKLCAINYTETWHCLDKDNEYGSSHEGISPLTLAGPVKRDTAQSTTRDYTACCAGPGTQTLTNAQRTAVVDTAPCAGPDLLETDSEMNAEPGTQTLTDTQGTAIVNTAPCAGPDLLGADSVMSAEPGNQTLPGTVSESAVQSTARLCTPLDAGPAQIDSDSDLSEMSIGLKSSLSRLVNRIIDVNAVQNSVSARNCLAPCTEPDSANTKNDKSDNILDCMRQERSHITAKKSMSHESKTIFNMTPDKLECVGGKVSGLMKNECLIIHSTQAYNVWLA